MDYIAERYGEWYEGNAASLRLMVQNLLLLPVRLPEHDGHPEILFREEYFNSATRIRRGRLYQKTEHFGWGPGCVSRFPLQEYGNTQVGLAMEKVYRAAENLMLAGRPVVLGAGDGESHWLVVFAEKTSDCQYLTLKSKTYFGVLPEVNWEAIPEANRQDIQQALDAVVEAAPTQAPQPVIDACRNAACHMIVARFPGSNPKGRKDLAQLASWLEQEGHRKKKARKADAEATDALIELPDSYTSYVVNELHRRAKANAAAARCTRPASQQDANLAVDAIAFLLQDFGWAEVL